MEIGQHVTDPWKVFVSLDQDPSESEEWIEAMLTDSSVESDGRLLCLREPLVVVGSRGALFHDEGSTCMGAAAILFVAAKFVNGCVGRVVLFRIFADILWITIGDDTGRQKMSGWIRF